MKILYGVQATGNGHITRARALNKYLRLNPDIEVNYLFSGRPKNKFFDMEEFGTYYCFEGLTFAYESGKIQYLKTIKENRLIKLLKDVKSIDTSDYDLIITDFEPITAWAAKLSRRPSIGIGHQYAFIYDVPKKEDTLFSKFIMRFFAPVDTHLGLHWHHFNQPILPPIVETDDENNQIINNKIIVYLGFENCDQVIKMLAPLKDYTFFYYGDFQSPSTKDNIHMLPFSRDGFKRDLATSAGVICNAGFELSSEAIHLGKKILVKPLQGQMEQLSNAAAMSDLGYGLTMNELDSSAVRHWLDDFKGIKVRYPNVASEIVNWLTSQQWRDPETLNQLSESLWMDVKSDCSNESNLMVEMLSSRPY